MNSKDIITDFFVQRKRRNQADSSLKYAATKVKPDCAIEAASAFLQLQKLFPVKELCSRLPPVILVHQFYSLLKNRTAVDKEINGLVEKGVIRLFKLGMKETAVAAISSKDFNSHVLGRICPCQVDSNSDSSQKDPISSTSNKYSHQSSLHGARLTIDQCHAQRTQSIKPGKESNLCTQSRTVIRFLHEFMPMIHDVSVDKELLQDMYNFRDEDIRTLMNVGLLVVRSIGSYWLSFPNAGEFMKHLSRGRASIIRLIKKCKFSEILQPELEKRQLEKSAKLGVQYHIHDLIGGDFVECVESTSGTILRIAAAEK